MNIIIDRTWKQGSLVNIEDLRGLTFQAEAQAHTFRISGVDAAGNPITLTGTPSGVMLRPDNTDVALTCAVSDGKVTATLPAECYDVPGRVGITIYLTSNSQKVCIYSAITSVNRTSSGTASPGTTSSVVDLINAINAAINSIPASYSNLLADIAPTYSDSALYAIGQYAWYDGDLKRCIVPITTFESYTAAHWTSAVLGQDVCDLKSALNASTEVLDESLVNYETVETGKGINYTTGATSVGSAYAVTNFIDVSPFGKLAYKKIHVNLSSTTTGMAFYDSNENRIDGIANDVGAESIGYNSELAEIKVPSNAKYARFSTLADMQTYGSFELYGTSKIKQRIDANEKNIDLFFDIKQKEEWVPGSYRNTDGTIDSASVSYSQKSTKVISVNDSYGASIVPKENRQVCVAYFNKSSGAFIERTLWSKDEIVIDTTKNFGISVCTLNTSSLTTEQLLENVQIFIPALAFENYIQADKKTIIQSGWASATTKPQNYYVNCKGIDFIEGDTLTPRQGYELVPMNSSGATMGSWNGTKYTFANSNADGGVVIRKTNAESAINPETDGYLLTDYITEIAYSSKNIYYQKNYLPEYLTDGLISDLYNQLSTLSKWKGKKAAFIGDSITAGINTSQGNIYYQILNSMIDFSNVYADGVSGSAWSIASNEGSSYTPISQRWGNIPTDRDLIVIFAGTNDWGHDTLLGTIADTTDISFYGALYVTISGILQANPSGRLVLLTPLHRWGVANIAYPNDTDQNGQGYVLKDYVDAMKESAEMFGVPVIDLFSIASLNPRISAIKTAYVTDGLHPNAAGHRILADRIKPLLDDM